MQKFRVFFNKIVQQASGETGEVEIVRYQVGKMAKPVQANFLLNTNLCKAGRLKRVSISQWVKLKQVSVQQAKRTRGEVQNLCKAGRLKQVSISQWVKLNNFQFASEANKGQTPKPLQANWQGQTTVLFRWHTGF